MMLDFKVNFRYVKLFQGAQDWDGEDYQYDAGAAYEYGGEENDDQQT